MAKSRWLFGGLLQLGLGLVNAPKRWFFPLAFFLITGLGGTGKSALVYELRKRGRNAVDADDVRGLSSWRNIRTGEVLDGMPPQPIDFTKYRFAWDEAAMLNLFGEEGHVFLCGGAWNARLFYPCFEHIFVLTPDKPVARAKPKASKKPPVLTKKQIEKKKLAKTDPALAEPLPNIPGASVIQGARSIPAIADEVLSKAQRVLKPRSFPAFMRFARPKAVRLVRRLEARRTPRTA
jgi:hypothetical protein